MRGLFSIGILLLFGVFMILKGIGRLYQATAAALDGDMTKFLGLLTTAEAKKISAASIVVRSRIHAISPQAPNFKSPSTESCQKLGYGFAWANLLWAEDTPTAREKHAKRFLQSIFGEEYVDLWLLSGSLAQNNNEAFLNGAEKAGDEWLAFVSKMEPSK